MAERTVDPTIVPFSVTTPTGTLSSAPQFTTVPIAHGQLVGVELQIPPGHAGVTGIRVELAQQQIIPYSTTPSWVLGDDYVHQFDTDVEVDTGLRVATYNVGNYPHTHYLRFTVRKLAVLTAAARLTPLTIVPRSVA